MFILYEETLKERIYLNRREEIYFYIRSKNLKKRLDNLRIYIERAKCLKEKSDLVILESNIFGKNNESYIKDLETALKTSDKLIKVSEGVVIDDTKEVEDSFKKREYFKGRADESIYLLRLLDGNIDAIIYQINDQLLSKYIDKINSLNEEEKDDLYKEFPIN